MNFLNGIDHTCFIKNMLAFPRIRSWAASQLWVTQSHCKKQGFCYYLLMGQSRGGRSWRHGSWNAMLGFWPLCAALVTKWAEGGPLRHLEWLESQSSWGRGASLSFHISLGWGEALRIGGPEAHTTTSPGLIQTRPCHVPSWWHLSPCLKSGDNTLSR